MVILIAYATANGSTRSIAQRIAAQLAARGHEVKLRPMAEVDGLAGYDAFVLGSAIHDRSWLSAAAQFVEDNVGMLASRPTWLFSVGMPAAVGRPFRTLAMREGPLAVAAFNALIHPRDAKLFSGIVRREGFPKLRSRITFRLMGCHYGDFRDWPAIDAWAADIAEQLEHGMRSGPVTLSG